MSNGKIPDHLAEQLARAMAYKIDIAAHSVTTNFSVPREINNMPGKYNIYDHHDLPDDLRKLMEQKEEDDKLVLPKELVEKQHMNDTIDALRRQMELEREKFERNDPVQRELRDLRNEVEHLKDAMRKIGVLLDTDIPDPKAFEEFKMLREAFKKYKMVEKLVLGEDDGR